jgi:hypothetical protein
MTSTSEETEWLRGLFASQGAEITWAEIRELRRKAKLTRAALRAALRELEFGNELECDRSATDPDVWVWRRKSAEQHQARRADSALDPAMAVVDRAEMIALLDAARRLTHPDVSKAENANAVTAKLNVMVDQLRGR